MPQKAPRHHLQIPHLQRRGANRTRQAIGPHEDLLTTVKRCKLKWYGHVTRSSGIAKTILEGTVLGGRRRGRQKKRWEDNIPEWTGMTLSAAMRKAERREEWRELVARSSGAPQRSTKVKVKLHNCSFNLLSSHEAAQLPSDKRNWCLPVIATCYSYYGY